MTPDNLYKKVFAEGKTLDLIPVTYDELVSLVDDAQLIPGRKYRITDYEAVFYNSDAEENFTSAGHNFDIVITAISEDTLSENCSAMKNDNDNSGYFDGNILEAWKIRYTLFPYGRFTDCPDPQYYPSYNPKGYIYEMTDEFYNTAPCDFKNLLWNGKFIFSREIVEGGVTSYTDASLNPYCYNNKVNQDWVQYHKERTPLCALISTAVGDLVNLSDNNITGRRTYIRAEGIRNVVVSIPMQSTAHIKIDGTNLFDISNCTFRLSGSLSLRAQVDSIKLEECTFVVGRRASQSTGEYIDITNDLVGCKFVLGGILHQMTIDSTTFGTMEGANIRLAYNENKAIISYINDIKHVIYIGTWNSGTSQYDWTDKSITL